MKDRELIKRILERLREQLRDQFQDQARGKRARKEVRKGLVAMGLEESEIDKLLLELEMSERPRANRKTKKKRLLRRVLPVRASEKDMAKSKKSKSKSKSRSSRSALAQERSKSISISLTGSGGGAAAMVPIEADPFIADVEEVEEFENALDPALRELKSDRTEDEIFLETITRKKSAIRYKKGPTAGQILRGERTEKVFVQRPRERSLRNSFTRIRTFVGDGPRVLVGFGSLPVFLLLAFMLYSESQVSGIRERIEGLIQMPADEISDEVEAFVTNEIRSINGYQPKAKVEEVENFNDPYVSKDEVLEESPEVAKKSKESLAEFRKKLDRLAKKERFKKAVVRKHHLIELRQAKKSKKTKVYKKRKKKRTEIGRPENARVLSSLWQKKPNKKKKKTKKKRRSKSPIGTAPSGIKIRFN